MSMWVRRVLLGVLGLLLALIALGTWLVMSFDANGHKGVAIEWMKTHYNRTLAIDGPIGLSVFPRLQVSLADVRLSEAGRTDEFASLKSAELAVDVWPLLRGEVVVGRVAASGVRAQLLRDAQGVRNIDDLIKPTPTKPTAPTNAKQPANFDIQSIALDTVSLRVRDEQAQLDGDVTLKKLTTGRLSNQLETPVALEMVMDFKTPAVRGQLKGEAKITPDLDSGSVALKAMDLAFSGELPGAKSVEAKLSGSAGWDGATSAADAQALKLTLSATLDTLRIDDSSLAIDRFAFNPGTKTLNVGQLQWRLKGNQGNAPVTLALDWPELTVAGTELKGSGFSGRLQRAGDAPADVSFKSGAPTGSFDALRLPGIEATFQSGNAQRKLAGTLQANVLLRPGKEAAPPPPSGNGKKDAAAPGSASVELDAINLSALLENPGLQPFKVNARGSASASAQRASWKLAGDLQGGGFDTDGSAVLGGTVPKVTARARFDALDLNRLLDTPAPAPAAKSAPPAADAPVDLSGLRAIDGQFSLTAQTFAWKRYRVSPLRLDATLDSGLLKVTTLQGKIWNGAVDATASADANTGRVAMKGTASGIDLNRAVKDVADKDWIEGTGRVAMDIASTGPSVNALKSALQGQLAMKLQNGAVKGINLGKAIGSAKSAIGLGQNQAQKASETEKTEFSEMSVSFQVANGVARSKDLDIRSPLLRIDGEGDIDIGKSRIDYLARATVLGGEKSGNKSTDKSGDKGWSASDLLAYKGLQVPVRLSGPFNALGWNLEWGAVKLGAELGKQLKSGAQDMLEKSLGLKKDAPADKNAPPAKKESLGDTLKGLMR